MDDQAASILGNFAARVQEIRDAQILPLPVPRFTDFKVIVKLRPLRNATIVKGAERIQNAKRDRAADVTLDTYCDMLIESCEAVVAVINGVEYSMRQGDFGGEPTRFDPDLAETLGLDRDAATARQVVQELFITDLDIDFAVRALVQFSGAREQDVEALLAGE